MGIVTIQEMTCKNPISLIGYEAGICWGAAVGDQEKDKARGLDCLKCNHGRTLEFPQIYITIDGYSARMVRELYTHIGGAPTRLQASTRYIKYGNFEYIVPPSIERNRTAKDEYESLMFQISEAFKNLELMDIPNEDIANILPLGMQTKMVLRTNLRQLLEMAEQRLCSRAYWEFRVFMRELINKLKEYSSEWEELLNEFCKCKCEILGYCPERYSCGRFARKC